MISSSGKPLSIFSAKDFHCSGSLLGRENNSIPRKLLLKQFCNPTGWSPFEFGIAARKAVRVGSMARMPMRCIFHHWLASQLASPLCSLASQFASQSPLCALASQSGLGSCLPSSLASTQRIGICTAPPHQTLHNVQHSSTEPGHSSH